MPARVYYLSVASVSSECDTVVALSADRDTAEENKYCQVPGPGEHMPDVAPPTITLERGDR